MTDMVELHMQNLLLFLDTVLPFANCHMVDYFTKSLFITFISEEMRNEIKGVGYNKALDIIFQCESNFKTPHLNEFIKNCKSHSLYNRENVCLNIDQFQDKILGRHNLEGLKLEVFMKSKKSHEVEVLSTVAAALHKIGDTSHIVDIGDGKGYLSSMLALHYRIPVLGIDSSPINTKSAVKRVQKLQKMWPSISKTPKRDQQHASDGDLYKQITRYVREDADLKQLVENVFVEPCTKLGVVGLHTCGNLAPTSLRIFTNNTHVRTLCNVSCCYHLLTETTDGFPMSEYVREKNLKLGHSARMLSAQSIDRILHNKETPNNTLFYRALLQALFQKHCNKIPDKNVGRLKRECNSFADYVRTANERVGAGLNLEDGEIEDFYDFYKDAHEELHVFNLLRAMLAPAIESLILLDRLIYLQEQGIENSYLVRLFDPVISPRCYGILAFKT